MVSRGLSVVCCGSGRSLGMSGPVRLGVLVMVDEAYVMGDGLFFSVA
jgi:hypothetical protein